jgi:hypothetical protein
MIMHPPGDSSAAAMWRVLQRLKIEVGRLGLRESDRYFGRVDDASSLDAASRPW